MPLRLFTQLLEAHMDKMQQLHPYISMGNSERLMILITAKTSHHNSYYIINFLTANVCQQNCVKRREKADMPPCVIWAVKLLYVRIWI